MTASTKIKHFTDGSLLGTDGAAHSMTIPLGQGDIKIDGLSADQVDIKAYQVRGILTSLRKGEQTFPTVSFSAALADLSSAADDTACDFLLKRNKYSGNTSTSASLGDVYTVDLTFTIEATALDGADHTVAMTDVHIEAAIAEGEPNTLSFQGTIYGTVTFT